ncbi:MAG: hypothetical protein QOG25_1584 [Acetobacteraceae bacterium]|nr:hypothetical protein [Acetobacteraceae bacterium]
MSWGQSQAARTVQVNQRWSVSSLHEPDPEPVRFNPALAETLPLFSHDCVPLDIAPLDIAYMRQDLLPEHLQHT